MEELNDQLAKKKAQIAHLMEKTSEVRRMTEELKQSLSSVCEHFSYNSFSDLDSVI